MKPACLVCRHFWQGTEEPTCDAFPDGIPTPIWTMQVTHQEPYEGDHGIRFEEMDYLEEEED